MQQLKQFLHKHILWMCFLGVLIPLLTILGLQYRSLASLEKTAPVAQKMWMKNCLWTIASDVKDYFQTNAEQVLNIPASAVTQNQFQTICDHFKKHNFPGTKDLFIVLFPKTKDGENSDSQIYLYDPQKNSLELHPEGTGLPAITQACTPLKFLSFEESPNLAVSLTVFERDPQNRLILYPIVDKFSKVVAVAGMTVNLNYLKQTYFPQVMHKYLPKFFPEDTLQNVVISVRDSGGNIIYMTNSGNNLSQKEYFSMPLPFIFKDWQIGIRDCFWSPEQWAHFNFAYNLSLSVFMTVVLLGGILFTLRAAAREMKLSEMKTDFVSNVSHELRTPLSSIRVFGEFLKLGRVKDTEKIREYGEYIETESQRLTQLINNILDFSKIESGRKTYRYAQADMEETVAATIKLFEVRLKQAGFDVVFEPPLEPLPPVAIDRDAISQALINLMDNAVKYSGLAKEIFVKLEHQNGLINLSVTDHGIGIPPTDQQKIFEKFYRVSTGLIHDVKGSGLGLSIVKHIVEAHRGKVTVKSKLSQGTTFTIHLPVNESPLVNRES